MCTIPDQPFVFVCNTCKYAKNGNLIVVLCLLKIFSFNMRNINKLVASSTRKMEHALYWQKTKSPAQSCNIIITATKRNLIIAQYHSISIECTDNIHEKIAFVAYLLKDITNHLYLGYNICNVNTSTIEFQNLSFT